MRKMVLCSSALLILALHSAGFANPVEQGKTCHYTVGVMRQESKSYYTADIIKQEKKNYYTAGVIKQESKSYYAAESAATRSENEKPATDETQQDKEAERREPNCEGGVCRI